MSARQVSAVLGLWQDRPPEENLRVAVLADHLGYPELWIGEMATYDAFVLATAVAGATERIDLSVGPFAVHARTPMTVAMGVASVAHVSGRRVNVALGTSSDVVVERWHGRARTQPSKSLEQHAIATAELLSGRKAEVEQDIFSTSGYRLRLPPPESQLSIAAFGQRAIGVAARVGDRLLLNMVTPLAAQRLCEQVWAEADAAGRARPRVAVWLAAAVDPTPATMDQILMGKVGYLAAPGYSEMYIEAGFSDLVEFARTRPHPKELFAAIPRELVESVGLVGTAEEVRQRIDEYFEAGIDEVCIVPGTAGDDDGQRTLRALAPT